MSEPKPLSADQLRWTCGHDMLEFESTRDVAGAGQSVGQSLALESLRFGLDCNAPGQNIFVRGAEGTGRMTTVRKILEEIETHCEIPQDRCYVHNFSQPDRPRLISLPHGRAKMLRRSLKELVEYVSTDLSEAMNSDHLKASRSAMQNRAQALIQQISEPFEKELANDGLALVQLKTAHGAQTAIFPLWQGQAIPPEQFQQLLAQGQIPANLGEAYQQSLSKYSQRLPEITAQIAKVARDSAREVADFNERHMRQLVGDLCVEISDEFSNPALNLYLNEVIDDIVEKTLNGPNEGWNPAQRYGLNILLEANGESKPVVVENNPTLTNLLGTIEAQWDRGGGAHSDYRGIRGGSLLRADGGYLILDAYDLLSEPGSWKILMRTLRTGHLEIVPNEMGAPYAPISLKPEPIPVKLRVILLGSAGLYYHLDSADRDFSEQFKVLADFDDMLPRNEDTVRHYAQVLSSIATKEQLRHFTPCGVAALTEHGARVADRGGMVTARFGRIADLAREANWIANQQGDELVSGEHVRSAVAATKKRASLPSRRFQTVLKEGTIKIQTEGSTVGQVNGLAVVSSGPLKYGFPARITASIGAGHAGIIDIEGRASMSGSIHTKGFHILGGLLRHLLQTDHPLAFSASIAFEQSYGGIDGDSASGAEMCCLLSALTGIPLRQDLAITGAIDQHGAIQAIGGVNEKIEGFYDICNHFGLTGSQGVIIPASNAADLMLRPDVVEAAKEGDFHIYAVETIYEAVTLFTGVDAGQWSEDSYPEGSLLAIARDKAREFWEETVRGPQPAKSAEAESSDE